VAVSPQTALVSHMADIDGDSAGFLLDGFVDLVERNVLGLVLVGEDFGDGGGEGGFAVVDVANCAHIDIWF